MRINSSTDLATFLNNGGEIGHLTLNKEGQLETRNAFLRAVHKIIDALHMLIPGGAESIRARDELLSRTINDMIQQDSLPNPARTDIPRPSQDGLISREGSRSTQEAIQKELRDVAEQTIARRFPQLPEEGRAALLANVLEELQDLPEKMENAANPRVFLRGCVEQCVTDIAAGMQGQQSITGQMTAPSGPSVMTTTTTTTATTAAATTASLRQQLPTLVEDVVNNIYGQKDEHFCSYLQSKVLDHFEELFLERLYGNNGERLRSEVATYTRNLTNLRFSDLKFDGLSSMTEALLNLPGSAVPPEEHAAVLLNVLDHFQQFSKDDLMAKCQYSMEGLWRNIAEYIPQARADVQAGKEGTQVKALRTLSGPEDIQANHVLTQGKNTSFMVSVLNSMMTSEQGQALLKQGLLPDGILRSRSEDEASGFSALENSLAAAYANKNPRWMGNEPGRPTKIAELFGMTSLAEAATNLANPSSGGTSVKSMLDAGYMVILLKEGHYRAVVGANPDTDVLVLRNSLNGREEHIHASWLADATLSLMEYPQRT